MHQKTAQHWDIELLRQATSAARVGGWRVELGPPVEVIWAPETAEIHDEPPGTHPTLEEGIQYYAPEYRDRIQALVNRCIDDGTPFDEVLQIITARGRRVWVRIIGNAIRDGNGHITALQGSFQDISELIEARKQSSALSERLHQTLDNMNDGFFTLDRDWRINFVNKQAEELVGQSRSTLLGRRLWDLYPDEAAREFRHHYERALAEQRTVRFQAWYPEPLNAWLELSAHPSDDGLAVYFRDITSRIQAQTDLRERMKELQCLYHVLSLIAEQHRSPEAICNDLVRIIPAGLYHADRAAVEIRLGDANRLSPSWPDDRSRPSHHEIVSDIHQNGTRVGHVRFAYFEPLETPSGDGAAFLPEESEMLQAIAVHLGRMLERRETERQLARSERLNAVGELTGGVAHDFNNLLTVILGNSEVVRERLEHSSHQELLPLLDMTRNAAQRGAELTNRLLAFARKQALEPQPVDVNELIAGMDGLLRRTLGMNIEIETIRAGGLWTTEIDPGQLEVALLNLTINARDAMPDGGCLTIETANTHLDDDYANAHHEVRAGQYVLVSVSDTGTGMDPSVLDQAFQPFFTTKEAGRGSGLGLSMVYGFVKQSGGHAKIYSEAGEGTTIKLYFPRSDQRAIRHRSGNATEQIPTGTERILVVEDDELIRNHVIAQLHSLGYRTVDANSGAQGLERLREEPDVDLLFTDVIMPGGMNGRQLADAAKELRPDLPVLYTSGYTENAIVHHGRLDRGVHLLSKPFDRHDLATKVRRVLDEAAS